MEVDHAPCPNCAWMWYFDGPEDVAVVHECGNCGRDFRVGRWYGQHYPNALVGMFSRPACPQCNSTDSTRGKQVKASFPRLYLRQCNECWSVWAARS